MFVGHIPLFNSQEDDANFYSHGVEKNFPYSNCVFSFSESIFGCQSAIEKISSLLFSLEGIGKFTEEK